MENNKHRKNSPLLWLIWLLEGIVVGFGAILPGVSGGTLCAAFGMYRPLIETVSDLKVGLKKHGLMLLIFLIGVIVGFVGLSSVAALFFGKNTMLVTCLFIGFIVGTFPELWHDAGKDGRNRASYIALAVGFAAMLIILFAFKSHFSVTIAPGIAAYLLCGFLWGLGIIVPGLSSSSLMLFFGLYQPMLEGIAKIDMLVLLPMSVGIVVCVLVLSKAVNTAYKKYYSAVSHCVLGIVAATAVMILPSYNGSVADTVLNIVLILIGAVISYTLTRICDRIKEKTDI